MRRSKCHCRAFVVVLPSSTPRNTSRPSKPSEFVDSLDLHVILHAPIMPMNNPIHRAAHSDRCMLSSAFGQDFANQSGGRSLCPPREKEAIVAWPNTPNDWHRAT